MPPSEKSSGPPAAAASEFADRDQDLLDTAVPPTPATRRMPWLGGLVWLAGCGLINCVAVPIGETALGPPDSWAMSLMALGLGVLGGQIGALSTALVWGDRPFLVRLILLWLLGLVLYGCWFAGLLISVLNHDYFFDFRFEIAQAIATSLPLISLAVQAPHWFARIYLGWRVVASGAEQTGRPAQPLSIRDLLLGTTVVALTIAAIRLFRQESAELTTQLWVGWAIAVGVLALVSAALLLPLLVLVLRGWEPVWAILFILLASPLVVGTLILAVTMFAENGNPPPLQAIVLMLLAATSCVACTSAPLWLARLAGYRLKMGREL